MTIKRNCKGFRYDLTGKLFGRLTVLRDSGLTANGGSKWACECVCGEVNEVSYSNLKSGKTSTCGKGTCRQPALDLTGKKFGRWTILHQVESLTNQARFKCQCECGVISEVYGSGLRSGHSTQCKDCGQNRGKLVGQVFGKLTVLAEAGTNKNNVLWYCVCTCGRKVKLTTHRLQTERTRSCGRPECMYGLEKGESAFGLKLKVYQKSAAARGHEWGLTPDQFRSITHEPCHYCGKPPSQKTYNPHSNGQFTYNGIDRKDNDLGYTPDNVVPCCSSCNYHKGKKSYSEFVAWITRIRERASDLTASHSRARLPLDVDASSQVVP